MGGAIVDQGYTELYTIKPASIPPVSGEIADLMTGAYVRRAAHVAARWDSTMLPRLTRWSPERLTGATIALRPWHLVVGQYWHERHPGANGVAILLRHHSRGLRDVAEIVHDPRREQLAQRHSAECRMHAG